jgi:hypothetical protein
MYSRKRLSVIAVSTLISASVLAGASAVPALAGTPGPLGTPDVPRHCIANTFIQVDDLGVSGHSPIGSEIGKYNSGSKTERLSLSRTVTEQRQTAWSVGGSASIGWGIVQIQAQTSYNVTRTTTTGWTATDTMNVPGHRYGYMTPKVEYRNFDIWKGQYTYNCGVVEVKDYGIMKAIVVVPIFSECTTRTDGGCTPAP